MEISEKDFSEEFLSRFGDKEKQYILDFCNTFQRTFPNILDKDTLLSKINKLGSLTFNNSLLKGEITGETKYESPVKIEILPNMSDRDERNSTYHELFHLISYKGFEKGLYEDGMLEYEDELYTEHNGFDEIMNEFYTIKMLENEGRFLDGKVELTTPTKSNMTRIVAPQKGNGYIPIEPLAEIYDRTFGRDLLKAKLLDRKPFMDKFNKEFDGLNIGTMENQNIPAFAKLGIQMGEDKYRAGETALRIWKQKYIEKHSEDKFDLYEYLKESLEIQKSLYRLESFNKAFRGDINYETLPRYNTIFKELEEELIIKRLRPDLLGEQTEADKMKEKKQIRAVIDSLRDNIEGLTKEDIEGLSYGEIPEYTHSNMHCLVIKAGKKEFMIFAAEDGYRGSSEFTELPESSSQQIFGDNRIVEYATIPTPRDKWSIIKDENKYMDPNQNPLELVGEKRLDGTPIKEASRNNKKTYSQSFRESVAHDTTKQGISEESGQQTKTSSQSFRDSLYKARSIEKTGITDVKKSQEDIGLRKERGILIRQNLFGQLDEDGKRRLEEINRLLNIKNVDMQQYETNKRKQSHGQSR